jgi:DNA sulfur modification protein DndD
MILEYLKLVNFRQYKGDVKIEFSTDFNKNFTIIQGTNGAGKTTLLNAITWCLYKKELHTDEGEYKIYNQGIINEILPDETFEVQVELAMIGDFDDRKIKIIRSAKFAKNKQENIFEVNRGSEFKVFTVIDGNDKLLSVPELYVDKNLPEKIEGYFFFDGERLEEYFEENSIESIKNAVFKISQLNLFENMNKHLITSKNSFVKQIKELDNDYGTIKENKTMLENNILNARTERDEADDNIKKFKKELAKIEKELSQINHADKDRLEKEKKELENEINKAQKSSYDLTEKKREYVIKIFPLVLAYNPF